MAALVYFSLISFFLFFFGIGEGGKVNLFQRLHPFTFILNVWFYPVSSVPFTVSDENWHTSFTSGSNSFNLKVPWIASYKFKCMPTFQGQSRIKSFDCISKPRLSEKYFCPFLSICSSLKRSKSIRYVKAFLPESTLPKSTKFCLIVPCLSILWGLQMSSQNKMGSSSHFLQPLSTRKFILWHEKYWNKNYFAVEMFTMKVEKENLSLISFARWTKPKTVCTKCIMNLPIFASMC